MSEHELKNRTRRQALATALGAAGLAAVGGTQALANSRPTRPLKGKRVLIGVGDFSEALETYYMIYRLMEEGVEPVVAAPTIKRLQLVVHDVDPQFLGYTEKAGYRLKAQLAYKDVNPADYDGLLLPGGRAPEKIRQDKDLVKTIGHFLDNRLPLGAMCHGTMLIYTARPIKGLRLTGHGGIKRDIELLGGKFIDKPVVVDGSVVTSRGWGDLPYFMPKFLEVLGRK